MRPGGLCRGTPPAPFTLRIGGRWHVVVPKSEQENWAKHFVLRQEVLAELEKARQEKRIGKALEAWVKLDAPPAEIRSLAPYDWEIKNC